MKFTFERTEGDMAVIETESREFFAVPLNMVEGLKEGDVFYLCKDEEETEKRKENIKSLMSELFK